MEHHWASYLSDSRTVPYHMGEGEDIDEITPYWREVKVT
jgi:hypothetical protein